RPEPMPGDVHDVVDASHDPVVAVLVAARAVAGEVDARHLAPVLLLEALRVAVDRPQHAGPRLGDHEIAALVGTERLAVTAPDLGHDPREGQGGRARLRRDGAGEWRDHDAAGLGLPPRVDDRAAFAADDAVVPHPGLGIDRLAHGPEEAERAEVVLLRVLLAPLHEGADR